MNALGQRILEEIVGNGPISFARFMELALYAPGLGYYERRREIGRGGDFFTSVSVGPLFGELLAFQFAQWADADCPDGGVQIIEAGPHDATLATDILGWISRHRPDLFARLEYYLLDASPSRREWQEQTLGSLLPKVKWIGDVEAIGVRQISGIIFSNEFLDALPVHRLVWSADRLRWREGFVAVKEGKFKWDWDAASVEVMESLPHPQPELAGILPDGFITEICPAASRWWSAAASCLKRGKLMAIDYGLSAEELFSPQRSQGTLRAYRRHHSSGDLLSEPGEQDLTAHVNFSAITAAGQAVGLRTEFLKRQSQFLTEIMAKARMVADAFDPWDEKKTRQFHTLTHPEHLGHKFKVLVQSAP